MLHPGVFERAAPLPLHELARALGAKLANAADEAMPISDVKPLQDAGPGEGSFFENRNYLPQLLVTRASACLVAPTFAGRVPGRTAVLLTDAPYRAFARALQLF